MLEINWSDVSNILNLCRPYLIALGVIIAAAVLAIILCRRMPKHTKYMIRMQSVMGIVLALAIVVNMVCFGPLSTMITLASGDGKVTDETIGQARELSRTVADEGIVMLENDGIFPMNGTKKLNVFGWSSTNPYYGGTGSGGFSDTYETISLLQGLGNAGFETNTELSDFYTAYAAQRPAIGLFAQDWTLPEPPAAAYTDELLANAEQFSDTALIIISRSGGEGADLPQDITNVTYNHNSKEYNDFEPGEHYLQLNRTERDMVDLVCSRFENVAVVYCGANTFELGFVKDYPSIKGLVWCQGLGQSGFDSLGRIISGAANPSGKTSDTFVKDIAKSPWYNNFGDFAYDNVDDLGFDTKDQLIGVNKPHFVNYVEGIYVGYRFYETASDEGFISYEDEVLYPFGYGLSYTTFDQKMGELKEGQDGSLSVDVTVTNTGDMAGRDTVELYYNPPYTNGGIEKASVNLIAFDKTDVLEPGKSQTLTLSFTAENMASFDTYGKGVYVLEKGTYLISLRSDSHTVIDEKEYKAEKTIVYDSENKRSTDETAAVRAFEFAQGDVIYLSRADGFANYEEATAAPASYSMSDEIKAEYVNTGNYNPKDHNNPDDEMPATGTDHGRKLADLRGAEYDDPAWEELLDQMSVEDMKTLIALGGYQTNAVESIGKLSTIDADGPASITNNFTGVGSIGMPSSVTLACTWNEDLGLEYGRIMGKMCAEMGVSGWYAPAINTHRAALGGREFEYVSEDGFLSGSLIAQEVIGAKEHGVYSYIKHYALNDQETNRWNMVSVWANEQSIREIYLKPFEIAVKKGGAQAAMSSYSYLGTQWCGGCSSLLNTVLRDEWGFRGMVITDYFLGLGFMNADVGIRNGNDLCLIAYDVGANMVTDTESATGIKAMRTACRNILYTVVNSRAYAPENLNAGGPGWHKAAYAVDGALAVLFIGLEVLIFRAYKKRRAGDHVTVV